MLKHPMSDVNEELMDESYLNKSSLLKNSSSPGLFNKKSLLGYWWRKGCIIKEEFLEMVGVVDRYLKKKGGC